MAEFKRLKLADIFVGPRRRPVEEGHALAIARSMAWEGQITPIAVRATPAAKTGNYRLIAGAHRMRAVELNQGAEIDAVVLKADEVEGQLMEISENLFRNDLSVIDRAIFVATYRELWEQKHGAIRRGPKGNLGQVGPNSCAVDLISADASGGFAQHVADRLGISERSAKRLDQIARQLHPDVRSAVRGTPMADNQSALLKLAKLEPAAQRKVAVALNQQDRDLPKALALVEGPKPKVAKDEAAFEALVVAWSRAKQSVRDRFLEQFGLVERAAVIMDEVDAEFGS